MIYKYFLLFQSVWLCPLIHRSFKFRCHPICLVLLLLPVDWCYTQETIAKPNVMKVFLWILFLSLTFRSLIQFSLHLYMVLVQGPTLLFSVWIPSFPSTICWKDAFPQWRPWYSCQKSLDHIRGGLFLDSLFSSIG